MAREDLRQGQARAKAAADRRHHMRIASTLAHYLRDGGDHGFREELPGSGAEIARGRVRFCFDVDAASFWRTYAALEQRRGGGGEPTGRAR
ncbi:MAG: hypothetical protein FJZ92_11175 [Chloroflexi bacterium]|nr:hypothetical protein [Chloroflexota bacterium]